MNTNFDDYFGSRFVSAADLQAPTIVTIEKVDGEDFARPGEPAKRKPVLYFRGRQKALVLNKVNAFALAAAHGKDMSRWIGARIQLRPETTTFGGKPTPCIRTYPVSGEVNGHVLVEQAPPPAKKGPAEELVDEEIPW
jgi:hypothetical protein